MTGNGRAQSKHEGRDSFLVGACVRRFLANRPAGKHAAFVQKARLLQYNKPCTVGLQVNVQQRSADRVAFSHSATTRACGSECAACKLAKTGGGSPSRPAKNRNGLQPVESPFGPRRGGKTCRTRGGQSGWCFAPRVCLRGASRAGAVLPVSGQRSHFPKLLSRQGQRRGIG